MHGRDVVGKARLFRRAALSLYSLAVLYFFQTGVALCTSSEDRHPYAVAIGNSVNATIIFALLIYLGRGFRYGRRVGGTIALTAYVLLQALFAFALIVSGGYSATPLLRAVHILYLINVIVSFVLVLGAWSRKGVRKSFLTRGSPRKDAQKSS